MLRLWKNLSISKKVWGLILFPSIIIFALTGREVLLVNEQLSNLKKASYVLEALALIKHLNVNPHLSSSSIEKNDIISKLNDKSILFLSPKETKQFHKLLIEYKKTLIAIKFSQNNTTLYSNTQWQIDVYKEILLAIEQVTFKLSLPLIDNHLNTLIQLEWIVFWAKEENKQSGSLIAKNLNDDHIEELRRSDIHTLIRNQQLFVERLIAINADQNQINLLLAAFSNIAFEKNNSYRESLLNKEQTAKLTAQEITQGNSASSQRLALLQNVSDTISTELKQTIQKTISTYKHYKLIFFVVIVILIIFVLILGFLLAHRIINNLKTILTFLENKNDTTRPATLEIEGYDELYQFAKKVEGLTLETQKYQKEILNAKNEALFAQKEAVKANHAKSSFLANMSHEIRTPLNGVIGVSELLSNTVLNTNQKDYVDTIETSSHLLLNLINDILDFSKIESGKLSITPNPISPREIIYDVCTIIIPKIKEKNITLKINISPNLPAKVLADDYRLKQVLINLMSNAVKFTSSGGVSISIQFNNIDNIDNKADFLFKVTDTGIGIKEEHQKKIFKPFSQEDNSTTRHFGGSGLGLAISKQLIDLMGGELTLISEKDKGSEFCFSLSLKIVETTRAENTFFNDISIILVCSDVSLATVISKELNALGIYSFDIESTLQNIISQKSAKSRIIIFAHFEDTSIDITLSQLDSLNKKNNALCLIQPLNANTSGWDNYVTSLVTYPVLGNKLLKALKNCVDVIHLTEHPPVNTNPYHATNPLIKEEEEQKIKPISILLVEDNKINQKVAKFLFERVGYQHVVANNGQEAIDLYKKNHLFDIILMDLMMPIKDGFEASKEIRAYEKSNDLPETPIIAVTASVVNDDIQQCFKVGMNGYIPKPIQPDLLYSEIKGLIT